MSENTANLVEFPAEATSITLDEILRDGAQMLLIQAVQAEVDTYLESRRDLVDENGRRLVVRNGYLPEREIQTPIGPIEVKQPRVRDRREPDEREAFSSKLLPPYLRKTRSMEELIPYLYLKGVSTGDFTEALQPILGPGTKGLSATTVTRLKKVWEDEYKAWASRSLKGRQYAYFWVDGVYFKIRLESPGNRKQCILVIIGVTAEGTKELVAIEDGYRESEQSWTEILEGLKHRGLDEPPSLAIGDGALGFWKAVSKVFPSTRHQRCWVHKTANVLNKMPKSVQPKAKSALHEIWQAETREDAEKAFDTFRKRLKFGRGNFDRFVGPCHEPILLRQCSRSDELTKRKTGCTILGSRKKIIIHFLIERSCRRRVHAQWTSS